MDVMQLRRNLLLAGKKKSKNLLDPAYRDESFRDNIFYYRDSPLTLEPNTYTMSCSIQCTGLYVVSGGSNLFVKYNNTALTFTLTETKAVSFNFYKSQIDHTADCQLEVGSQATPYEPY